MPYSRSPRLRRATIAAAAAAAAVAAVSALAGCQPSSLGSGSTSGSGGGSQASPAGKGSGANLVRLHDPKEVTYSIHLTTCQAGDGGQLPDPKCTPGGIDPAVTQSNLKSTICRESGYTSTVRPPSSQTSKAKYDVAYPAYGLSHSKKSELDHLVSLELGGDNDIANLWPEVGKQPNPKDTVENHLHDAVCDGKVSLADAQDAIATNWETAEDKLGISDSSG